MAYKPGSQVKQFFRTGGFTLTDRSPNYKTGKIPLFKSLKNLSPRERLYAIGYNFSTLGAFGLDIGYALSIPYQIGEFTNTARSVMKNMKQPTQLMGGQIIKRQKLLGGARAIGKTKSNLTKALRTGTPVDRATSILIGRESASFLQQVRDIGTGGIVMNVVQAANAAKMDRQIQSQAQVPTKHNVFIKWRALTFSEAFKNAPDPFRDNPIRKAEKIRHKTVHTKGQEFDMSKVNFRNSLETGIDVGRANQLMSMVDMQNFAGADGLQKDIVNELIKHESKEYYLGKGDKRAYLSDEARMRAYEQSDFVSARQLMGTRRGGSARNRTYDDRDFGIDIDDGGLNLANDYRDDAKGRKVQDIIFDPESGMVSTHQSRMKQVELNQSFQNTLATDIGSGNPDVKTFQAYEVPAAVIPEIKELARAFNHPFASQNIDSMNGMQLVDVLSGILTEINVMDINTTFPLGINRGAQAIINLQKKLKKHGYNGLANKIRKEAGFTVSTKDPMIINPKKGGGFLLGRNQTIAALQPSLRSGALYTFTLGGNSVGPVQSDLRVSPVGGVETHKYYREVMLNRGRKSQKLSLNKINIVDNEASALKVVTSDSTNARKKRSENIIKRRQQEKPHSEIDIMKGLHKEGSTYTEDVFVNALQTTNVPVGGFTYSFEDIMSGRVKGLDVQRANGMFKGVRIDPAYATGGKLYGKPVGWWNNKLRAMEREFVKNAQDLLGIADPRVIAALMDSEAPGSMTRRIERALLKRSKAVNKALNNAVGGQGLNIKQGEDTYKGVSTLMPNHDNFTPKRSQIRKSIHMHDMERFGVNENDGTPFTFRFSVSFGGSSPQSKTADYIRDAKSIEFGGLAHDKNMKRERRTDGMFYLPSNMMGIAGTKAAAYLGIWDKGSNFKTSVDGQKLIGTIQAGGISPFDLKSDAPGEYRSSVRKDLREMKQARRNAFKGNERLKILQRDIDRAIKQGGTPDGSVMNNSSYDTTQARIASNRALALFRNSGQFGNVRAADVFTVMDDVDKANLGINLDDAKIASNYEMRNSAMGTYGAKRRYKVGEFDTSQSLHGATHSYRQGNDHLGKMYSYKFEDLATGKLMYGEMPVLPLLNSELFRIQRHFQTTNTTRLGVNGKPNKLYGQIVTDWEAFSEFTGMSISQLKYQLSNIKMTNEFPDIVRPYKFDFDLNPSDNANVRDIFDSPTDKMVEIFGLNRINGPNKLPDGTILPLSNPGHPSNVFKNTFLSGEMTKHIFAEVHKAYRDELSLLIRSSNPQTRKMIEQKIIEYARTSATRFDNLLNKALLKHLGAGSIADEYQFRQLLMRLQYGIRWSKLNATKHAQEIRNRYGRVGLLPEDIADQFFSSDGGFDIELFNAAEIVLEPDEAGFKLVTFLDDEVQPRSLDVVDMTPKELELMEYFDPVMQAQRNFAANPSRGAVGTKGAHNSNIYSQAQVREILDGITHRGSDMRVMYQELYEAYADEYISDAGGGKLLKKYSNGMPIGVEVDGIERAVIEGKQRTSAGISSDIIEGFMSAAENQRREVNKLILKLKDSPMKAGQAGSAYWKAVRNSGTTPNELYKDISLLVKARSLSPSSQLNRKDLAALIKSIWLGSVPTGSEAQRGKAVLQGKYKGNFLEYGSAALADNLTTLPPELNQLIQAFSMAGYNFKNFVNTDSWKNIPQLQDEDFLEIANLFLNSNPNFLKTPTSQLIIRMNNRKKPKKR